MPLKVCDMLCYILCYHSVFKNQIQTKNYCLNVIFFKYKYSHK